MKTHPVFLFIFSLAWTTIHCQNVWTQKPTFAGPARSGAVAFSIGKYGFVGTGGGNSVNYDDFWRYDTVSGVWTQLADVSGGNGRSGAVGFAIGGNGYIGTGSTGGNNNSKDDFYEYDTTTNNWTQKPSLPGTNSKRRFAYGFSIGGRGYIGGGDGINADPDDLLEYNPNSNLWTTVANNIGGTGLVFATAFTIGNKAYIGTGNGGSFYEWDQPTGAWTSKSSYPGNGSLYLFGFSIHNLGYMGGGRDVTNMFEVQDFWEYNPISDQWIQKADFGGGGRAQAFGFSVGNKGFAGTGFIGNSSTQDFWQYSPDTLVITGNNISLPEMLSIYPNPSSGRFLVQCPDKDAEITIIDLWGKPVRKFETTAQASVAVDLSDEKSGVYFVIITIENKTSRQKLVVLH